MQLTDPQKFTIISAIIVAAVMVATGFTSSWFFRQAIIERETAVMRDMIQAMMFEEEQEGHITALDIKTYAEGAARTHLETAFRGFTGIAGLSRFKLFDRDLTIVWSNVPELIGTKQTFHPAIVAQAIENDVATAINPTVGEPGGDALIEFYLPFRLAVETGPATGALAIYRSAAPVDAAIHQGVRLLWLVTGLGGLVMYAALYRLFLAVHRGRLEIRSKFAAFSAEHDRLIQLEKLSAMGQMVTEIAHQLNNPLVGVVNLAELAGREADNPERVKTLLGQVRTAGERCREYVDRILRLGQLHRPERQPTDLGQLVRDTAAFFEQSLGGRPPLALHLPDQPVTCEVDPALMRNALFNLVHNAAQADPAGPVVVSLAREERDGAPGYSLTVADRGPGFPPEAFDKVFTPFFTTRAGGTGLGLSIAQHIAILHGGTIAAVNPREGGARVTMWIPASGALRDRENPARRG